MSSAQPQLEPAAVLALLQEHMPAPIERLEAVTGGQIARTFSFASGGQEYIVRFNTTHMGANFAKEAYIYDHFASPLLPIAPVMHVGHFQDLIYAISRKLPGRPLTTLSRDEHVALLPALMRTLDAIHACDIGDQPGWGTFGDDGAGLFTGWRASLALINQEEPEWDFFGKWHTLFDTTFLERAVFDRIYSRMTDLLPFCPEDRSLVHGNFGFGNVLAQDGRITGVLDWIDAKYGDFVYDIAWLDFWAPDFDVPARFAAHYASAGTNVPHYDERVLCYTCYIGLDALRFFAKTTQEDAYRWTRERLLARLDGSAG
jgi:hygromycin-B 4-O-kinase